MTGPYLVTGHLEKKPRLLNAANGRIAYRFHARDLNLIMGSGGARGFGALSRADRWTAAWRRSRVDVDGRGNGTVSESRLYQLIRQPKPIADRHF